jgi:hypothetical protein
MRELYHKWHIIATKKPPALVAQVASWIRYEALLFDQLDNIRASPNHQAG